VKTILFEDQVFEKKDFSTAWTKGEYDHCTFHHCDFSNLNLSGTIFSDCRFLDSNLSLAKLGKTAFKTVYFKDCKLLGMRFDQADDFLFSVSFDHCFLNHSSFYKKKLKGSQFLYCKMEEVEFSEADLSFSVWDGTDLSRAKFENTLLERADFRLALHFSIDPEKNKIKKAKFSLPGVLGLLDVYDLDIELH